MKKVQTFYIPAYKYLSPRLRTDEVIKIHRALMAGGNPQYTLTFSGNFIIGYTATAHIEETPEYDLLSTTQEKGLSMITSNIDHQLKMYNLTHPNEILTCEDLVEYLDGWS